MLSIWAEEDDVAGVIAAVCMKGGIWPANQVPTW
jgi:hypothetical protein